MHVLLATFGMKLFPTLGTDPQILSKNSWFCKQNLWIYNILVSVFLHICKNLKFYKSLQKSAKLPFCDSVDNFAILFLLSGEIIPFRILHMVEFSSHDHFDFDWFLWSKPWAWISWSVLNHRAIGHITNFSGSKSTVQMIFEDAP